MNFLVSEQEFKRIEESIKRGMKWKMQRRCSPKVQKQLSELPAPACIICTATKEKLWTDIYDWQWLQTEGKGPKVMVYMKGN